MGKYSRGQWSIMGKQRVRSRRKLYYKSDKALKKASKYNFNKGNKSRGKYLWSIYKKRQRANKNKSAYMRYMM